MEELVSLGGRHRPAVDIYLRGRQGGLGPCLAVSYAHLIRIDGDKQVVTTHAGRDEWAAHPSSSNTTASRRSDWSIHVDTFSEMKTSRCPVTLIATLRIPMELTDHGTRFGALVNATPPRHTTSS